MAPPRSASTPVIDAVPLLRVVHVTTVPDTLDFLAGLIKATKKKGFEVHVVSSPGDRLQRFADRVGVTCHGISMARRVDPLRDLVALIRLWREFRHLRPTLVHAHTPKGGLLGMIAAWMARVPTRIYTIHGLPLQTAVGWKRRLLWCSERLSCLLAHERFCVSHSLGQAVEDEGICPSRRLQVLGAGSVGGVDALGQFDPARLGAEAREGNRRQLGIPAEARVIGFVGRIARDKGIIDLFHAWEKLRAEYADLYLLVLGTLETNDPIPPDMVDRMRQDNRVCLPGWADDPAPLYAAMDLLALPSYREGLSQTLLEAAAMRLPVVTTYAVGCVDPVQDGVTGTLVPIGDPDSLAESIRVYLDDPERRRSHGEAGRSVVLSDFNPTDVFEATLNAYVGLLKTRGFTLPDRGSDTHEGPKSLITPMRLAGWRTKIAKRLLDTVVATGGLIVFSPIMAIVALGIALISGRPVLFRQVRPGLNGKPFVLVKFRTMREANGPDGTPLPDSDRLTRLGQFLRRTSLDELPQLWNVLKGEMSLVGPRPLLVEYLPYYNTRQKLRHEVRPGITGLAQIHGRNLLPWEDRLEMDAQYVENQSFLLDLRILARTVLKVVDGSGVRLDTSRFDQVVQHRIGDVRGQS